MNKAELIDAIADSANLSKADAKRALDAFIDTTVHIPLQDGDGIKWVIIDVRI